MVVPGQRQGRPGPQGPQPGLDSIHGPYGTCEKQSIAGLDLADRSAWASSCIAFIVLLGRCASGGLWLYTRAVTEQSMHVDVVSVRERFIEDRPRQQDLGLEAQIELEAAIERSQHYLLSQQKPEGYWVGELMVDATLVADMVAYHHWNGKIDPHWQRKAVNHMFSMQLPDGGWNIYYGGPAEVNATIKCYLGLKLAGVPVTDPRMLRAREVAMNLGGVPRMNTFSKLYLALLGLFPWEYVPTIPCEVILIGKWFYVNFNEMSSWSRSMLVPLAIINHFKPTR
jgi:hypothetical protein